MGRYLGNGNSFYNPVCILHQEGILSTEKITLCCYNNNNNMMTDNILDENLYKELLKLDKNDLFEETLKKIGGFGRFQKLIWAVGLITCLLRKYINITSSNTGS